MTCYPAGRREVVRKAGAAFAALWRPALAGILFAVVWCALPAQGAEGEKAAAGKDDRMVEPERSGKPSAADRLGWRLAVQAYSLRKFTFFEALERTADLGIRHIEAYPGQRLSREQPEVRVDHNMPAAAREAVKKKLAEAGVELVNYGVVGLSKDEEACRKVFDFARQMGIETIVSEPPADALDVVERLCDEYAINVAIHNHPKPSGYWNPRTVLEACEGRSKRLGACADTGHWMRSAVNPVEALKMLEGRIVSLHLKDIDKFAKDARDVPWGAGKCDVRAMLAELKRQGVKVVIAMEYESNPSDPVPDMAKCVEHFKRVTAELAETGEGE